MAGNEIQSFDMFDLDASLSSGVDNMFAGLSSEDRAGIFDVVKRLQSLTGHHSDVLESLSPRVRKRIEILREIQGEHDDLEAKFFEERAVLEAKYQKLYEPLYTKRYEIVNGNTNGDHATEEKGVPDFWLNAMKANELLAKEITERDEEALKYLKDVKWFRIGSLKGFKLEFFFDPNPYFKNTSLTKTFHVIEEAETVLEKAIGTEIEWYPGKILTLKIFKKKSRKGGSTNGKLVTKNEDFPSFFNFFKLEYAFDDSSADEEHDFDIGYTIRDEIIPHAVSWFTGEAKKMEDNDEEDTDEDDEDESDDEEEEDNVINKKNGKAMFTGECPPLCKQQ